MSDTSKRIACSPETKKMFDKAQTKLIGKTGQNLNHDQALQKLIEHFNNTEKIIG